MSGREQEVKAPAFPRPSSATAKHRLQGRLLAHSALGPGAVPRPPPIPGKRPTPRSTVARGDIFPTRATAPVQSEPSREGTAAGIRQLTVLPEHCSPAAAVEILVSGQIDFLYLSPDPSCSYKLRILPNYLEGAEADGEEVITMSKTGIMRSDKSGGEPVHFSLKEYLEEYKLYSRLLDIPIFKNFRLWKTLWAWRQSIRRDIFDRRSAALKSNMLSFDETLGRILQFSHNCCLEIEHVALFSPPDTNLYNIDTFLEVTHSAIEFALQQKEMIIRRVVDFAKETGEAWLLYNMDTMPSKMASESLRQFQSSCKEEPLDMSFVTVDVKKSRNDAGPVALPPLCSVGISESVSAWGVHGDSGTIATPRAGGRSAHKTGGQHPKSINGSRVKGAPPSFMGSTSMGTGLTFTDRSFFRINSRRFFNLLCLIDFRLQRSLFLCVLYNFKRLFEQWNKPFMIESRVAASELLSAPSKKIGKDRDNIYVSKFFGISAQGNVVKSGRLGLITLELHPDLGGKVYTETSAEDFVSKILTVLKRILDGGIYQNPLVKCEEFATLLLPVFGEVDKSDLADLIHTYKDSQINTVLMECLQTLSDDAELCQNIAALFNPMSKKYYELQTLAASISDEMVCSYIPTDISDLLTRLQQDVEHFSLLPPCTDVGLLRLEIGTFKDSLISELEKCIRLLHEEIPRVFLRRGHDFVDGVLSTTDIMMSNPKSVTEFVKLLQSHNAALQHEEAQRDESMYLSGLKQVMEQQSIGQSTRVADMSSTLNVGYHRYLQAMNFFRDNVPERTDRFKKELFGLAKDIQKPVQDAYNRLYSDLICNPATKCTTALAELESIRMLVRSITKASDVIVKSQEVMELNIFDHMSVIALSELLSCNLIMWNSLDEIRVEHNVFISSPVRTADFKAMLEVLYNTRKRMFAFEELASGKVAELLEKTVSAKYHEIPLVVYLQEPYLEMRHKIEIEAALAVPVFRCDTPGDRVQEEDQQQDVTVEAEDSDIPDVKVMDIVFPEILDKTPLVKAICDQALREHNIGNVIRDVDSRCTTATFKYMRSREDKSIVLFAGLEELIETFNECLLSVQYCRASRFCAPHEESAERWQECIPEWINSIECLVKIQRVYLVLRSVYTSSRSVRYFHQSIRFFNVVEENWKFITHSVLTDPTVMFLMSRQGFKESIDLIQSSIVKAEAYVDTLLDEQRSKWPKLFLLYKEKLLRVYCKSDPIEIFELCRELLPGISSFTFGGPDQASASSCQSFGEEVSFHHPVSAKLPLSDFLRSVEQSMTDRLSCDINELLDNPEQIYKDSGVNLKGGTQVQRWCNQSKVLVIEILFWSEFNMCFPICTSHHDNLFAPKNAVASDRKTMASVSVAEKVRSFSSNVRKRLDRFADVIKHVRSHPGIIGNANIILALLKQRDIVTALEREIGSTVSYLAGDDNDKCEIPFWILSSTQTLWSKASSTAYLTQGISSTGRIPYGQKYLGLSERMVVTPLTDRCVLSMFSAFSIASDTAFPLMVGQRGQGKRSLVNDLSYSCGREYFNLDVTGLLQQSKPPLEESVFDRVNAVILSAAGCGLWASISGLESLTSKPLACLTTSFSILHNAVVAGLDTMMFHGLNVRLPQSIHENMPKICLIFNKTGGAGGFPNPFILSSSLRKQFRVVSPSYPEYRVVLVSILNAYQFSESNLLACRLVNFSEFLADQSDCEKVEIMSRLVRLVKGLAPTFVMKHISHYHKACVTAVKALFRSIPNLLKQKWNMRQLKWACTTFLSISFDGNFDANDLYHPSLADCHNNKKSAFAATVAAISDYLVVGRQHPQGELTSMKAAGPRASVNGTAKLSASATPSSARSSNCQSLIVVGPSRCGKSTAISAAVASSGGRVVPSALGAERNLDFHIFPELLQSHRHGSANGETGDAIYSIIQNIILSENNKLRGRADCQGDCDSGAGSTSMSDSLTVFIMNTDSIDIVSDYTAGWDITVTGSMGAHGIRIIWECLDLQHASPRVVASTPIVHISSLLYDQETQYLEFVEVAGKSIDNGVQAIIRLACTDYISGCVDAVRNDCSSLYVDVHSTAMSTINVIYSMLESCGALSIRKEPDLLQSLDITVRQIVLFACIWTFGVATPDSKGLIEDWFVSIWEKPRCSQDTSQDVLVSRIFPDSPRCFEYLLQPDGFNGRIFYWVQWQSAVVEKDSLNLSDAAASIDVLQQQGADRRVRDNISSGPVVVKAFEYTPPEEMYYYDTESSQILAPTALSKAMSFIVSHVMSSPTNNPHHVTFLGTACTSKSSILRLLAHSLHKLQFIFSVKANERRMANAECTKDGATVSDRLTELLLTAKSRSMIRFTETGISNPRSVLFIDDVSLQPINQNRRGETSLELLRCIYQQGALLYESSQTPGGAVSKRSAPEIAVWSNMSTVISAQAPVGSKTNKAVLQGKSKIDSVLRQSHTVVLEDDVLNSFAAVLSVELPGLNVKAALDLVSVTSKITQSLCESDSIRRSINSYILSYRPWIWTVRQIFDGVSTSLLTEMPNPAHDEPSGSTADISPSGEELSMQSVLRHWESAVAGVFLHFVDEKDMLKCLNRIFSETSFYCSGFTDLIHGTRRKASTLCSEDKKNLQKALCENATTEMTTVDDEEGQKNQKLDLKQAFCARAHSDVCTMTSVSELHRVILSSEAYLRNLEDSGIFGLFDRNTEGFWTNLGRHLSYLAPTPSSHRSPFYLVDVNLPVDYWQKMMETCCLLASTCHAPLHFDCINYCLDEDSTNLNHLKFLLVRQYQAFVADTTRSVSVWHIHIRNLPIMSPAVFENLVDVLNIARRDVVLDFEAQCTPTANLDRAEVRKSAERFLSQQRYVFSIGYGMDSSSEAPTAGRSIQDNPYSLQTAPEMYQYCFNDVCKRFFSCTVNTQFLNRCKPLLLNGTDSGIIKYSQNEVIDSVGDSKGPSTHPSTADPEALYRRWYCSEILRILDISRRPVLGSYFPSYRHAQSLEYTSHTYRLLDCIYFTPLSGSREVGDVSHEWMAALLWSHSKLKNIYFRNNKRQHVLDTVFRKQCEDYIVSNNNFGLNEFRHDIDYERVKNESQQHEYTAHLIRISLSTFVLRMRYFFSFDCPELFKGVLKRNTSLFSSLSEQSEEKMIDPVYLCSAFCKLLQQGKRNRTYETVIKMLQCAAILPKNSKLRDVLLCICLGLAWHDEVFVVDPSNMAVALLSKIFGLIFESVLHCSILNGHDVCRLAIVSETPVSDRHASRSLPNSMSTIINLASCLAIQQEDTTAVSGLLQEVLLLHCIMSPWLQRRSKVTRKAAPNGDSRSSNSVGSTTQTAANDQEKISNERNALNALMEFCIARHPYRWLEAVKVIRKESHSLFTALNSMRVIVALNTHCDILVLAERIVWTCIPHIRQPGSDTKEGIGAALTAARPTSATEMPIRLLSEIVHDLFDEVVTLEAEQLALQVLSEDDIVGEDAADSSVVSADSCAISENVPSTKDIYFSVEKMLSEISKLMQSRMVREEKERFEIMFLVQLSCNYISDDACKRDYNALFLFLRGVLFLQRGTYTQHHNDENVCQGGIVDTFRVSKLSAWLEATKVRSRGIFMNIRGATTCFSSAKGAGSDVTHGEPQQANQSPSILINSRNLLLADSSTLEESILFADVCANSTQDLSKMELLEYVSLVLELQIIENYITCSHVLWNMLCLLERQIEYGVRIFVLPVTDRIQRQHIVERLQDVLYALSRPPCFESILGSPYRNTPWSSLDNVLSAVGIYIVALIVDPTSVSSVASEICRKAMGTALETGVKSARVSTEKSVVLRRSMDGTMDLSKTYLDDPSLKLCKARGINVFSGVYNGSKRVPNMGASIALLSKVEYASNKNPTADVLAKPTANFVVSEAISAFELSWLISQLSGSRRNCVIEMIQYPQLFLTRDDRVLHTLSNQHGVNLSPLCSYFNYTVPGQRSIEKDISHIERIAQFSSTDIGSDDSVARLVSQSITCLLSDCDVLAMLTVKSTTEDASSSPLLPRKGPLQHRLAWLVLISHCMVMLQLRRMISSSELRRFCIGDDTLVAAVKYVLFVPVLEMGNSRSNFGALVAQYIAMVFYSSKELPFRIGSNVEQIFDSALGNENNLNEDCTLSLIEGDLFVPAEFNTETAITFLSELSCLEDISRRKIIMIPGLITKGAVVGKRQVVVADQVVAMDLPRVALCRHIDLMMEANQSRKAALQGLVSLSGREGNASVRINLKSASVVLGRMTQNLPVKIDLKRKEIVESGYHHRLIKAEGTLAAVLPALRQNKFNLNRRRHQRMRKQSSLGASKGEFDSIWSYALLEASILNDTLANAYETLSEYNSLVSEMLEMENEFGPLLGDQCGHFLFSSYPADFLSSVSSFSFGYVPLRGDTANTVSVDDWICALQLRHNMLLYWLMHGSPGLIYAHLLANPKSMLNALRETCLDKHQSESSIVHGIRFESEFLDPSQLDDEDVSELNKSDPDGTTVILSGLKLRNATWVYDDIIALPDEDDCLRSSSWNNSQGMALKISLSYETMESKENFNAVVYPIDDERCISPRVMDNGKELCPVTVMTQECVVHRACGRSREIVPVKSTDEILMHVPVSCTLPEKEFRASAAHKYKVAKSRITNVSHQEHTGIRTVPLPDYVSISSSCDFSEPFSAL